MAILEGESVLRLQPLVTWQCSNLGHPPKYVWVAQILLEGLQKGGHGVGWVEMWEWAREELGSK